MSSSGAPDFADIVDTTLCRTTPRRAWTDPHRDSHDAVAGPAQARSFQEAADAISRERTQIVLDAFEGVPKVSARPEFVAALRARLLEEARNGSSNQRAAW